MPIKKPPPAPSTATKPTPKPFAPNKALPGGTKVRQQADNRWQRSKRYGWDSR